jgi:hypothetical protein
MWGYGVGPPADMNPHICPAPASRTRPIVLSSAAPLMASIWSRRPAALGGAGRGPGGICFRRGRPRRRRQTIVARSERGCRVIVPVADAGTATLSPGMAARCYRPTGSSRRRNPARTAPCAPVPAPDAVRYMSVHSRKQPDSQGHDGTPSREKQQPARPGKPWSWAVSAGSGRCWVRTNVG